MLRFFFCTAYNNSCNIKYALCFPLICAIRDRASNMFPRLEYRSQGRVAGRLGHRLDNPVKERDFLLSRAHRLALGPIQPPTWWIPGALIPEIK